MVGQARPLTRREREILALIVDGHGNREIARRLGVRERTVKNQLYALFQKVDVRSRLQLAVWALRRRDVE